ARVVARAGARTERGVAGDREERGRTVGDQPRWDARRVAAAEVETAQTEVADLGRARGVGVYLTRGRCRGGEAEAGGAAAGRTRRGRERQARRRRRWHGRRRRAGRRAGRRRRHAGERDGVLVDPLAARLVALDARRHLAAARGLSLLLGLHRD